ncbi:MAG TPA: hypothetical protein VJN69_07175 [Candidatus Acidoferrales bacterium]|nr:hypothetical protein [Candidatus Acidoferrales bacterium]
MNDSLSNSDGYREVQCIYVGSKETQTKDIPEFTRSRPPKPVTRRSGESQEAFLKRHSRKCQVCHHPDRDAIEGAFVMWRRPRGIAQVYRLTGDSLYRHAVAFDLYTRRRNNLRSVLDNIMERGIETEITGETILGAVKAYTCLDDNNRWIEPTSNVLFSANQSASAGALASYGRSNDQSPAPALTESAGLLTTNHLPLTTASNRNSQELKIDVTS